MRPHLIHCSYHKCLTVYYGRIMNAVFNRCLPWSSGYRHFNSHLEDFYRGFEKLPYRLGQQPGPRPASAWGGSGSRASSAILATSSFQGTSTTSAVRRAGSRSASPTAADWYFANGRVPEGLQGTGLSFSEYLQSIPEEEGLLAELEFRTPHFESMALWPTEHPDIVTYRYEDIVGHEAAVFRELPSSTGCRLSSEGWARGSRTATRWADAVETPTCATRLPGSGGSTSRPG